MIIKGNIVDVVAQTIRKGIIHIDNGRISKIEHTHVSEEQYIVPGFIDAHIHIESSMMLPAEFARHAVVHGTVACVCDPHEIANVCGLKGIEYMIDNSRTVPMKFSFGAPSCVPATEFETSGARLDSHAIENLLQRKEIGFLAEMMDYVGVINDTEEVVRKLKAAKRHNKPIDGHAPELWGKNLEKYAGSGISTDHECMTLDEALEKIELGMKIQIREGSAAKNFDDLLPLVAQYADHLMFCSDDKHPDDLIANGHINSLAKRAIAKGYDPVKILRICSYNAIKHYKLNAGLLQLNDSADFVIVDNLTNLTILATYIDGRKVAENGEALFERVGAEKPVNQFNIEPISVSALEVAPQSGLLKAIVLDDGQLYTRTELVAPRVEGNNVVSDTEHDILKLIVLNRYQPSPPAIGFIKNFGLKKGALASTVAHDSHNIVAIGVSDEEITQAINAIINSKGGICATANGETLLLPLPVGGLMSTDDGATISRLYTQLDSKAKEMGTPLEAPFMTLAFMSLLVIPELKLSDRGLFDVSNFRFTSLFG